MRLNSIRFESEINTSQKERILLVYWWKMETSKVNKWALKEKWKRFASFR